MEPAGNRRGDEATPRPLFREAALQRYGASRDQAVLPRLAQPSRFAVLWLVLGCLVGAVAIAGSVATPRIARGEAIVAVPAGSDGAAQVAVFFPAASGSEIRPGDELRLGQAGSGASWRLVIAHVEPAPVERVDLEHRFGAAVAQFPDPAAGFVVAWAGMPADLAATDDGRIGTATVETGVVRLADGLPALWRQS